MSDPTETIGEDESPIPLATLGDVERAVAKIVRQMHKGSIDQATGHGCIIGLGVLAKIKEARIERVWTKRAEVMWKERQQKQEPEKVVM